MVRRGGGRPLRCLWLSLLASSLAGLACGQEDLVDQGEHDILPEELFEDQVTQEDEDEEEERLEQRAEEAERAEEEGQEEHEWAERAAKDDDEEGVDAEDAEEKFRRQRSQLMKRTAAPGEAGNELDDWKPLLPMQSGSKVSESLESGGVVLETLERYMMGLSVLGTIGIGMITRIRNWLPKERADVLRTVCFTWLMPAFLLRHIWLCQLDSSLYVVSAWSFGFHLLWFALSCRAAQVMEPQDRQMRGWTMLMSQGGMNSFLYPLLLTHDEFGERSLACAVLWDLGGNMWICQVALFAIAGYYSPNSNKDDHASKDAELGDQVAQGKVEPLESDADMTGWPEQVKDGKPTASLTEPPTSPKKQGMFETLAASMPKDLLMSVLTQPVLVCSLLGFGFNLGGVPLPMVADTPLWVIGEPYKIMLYFLVGYYGDHKVKGFEVRRMARALGVRYSVNIVMILVVALVLPLQPLYRYTVILTLMSPCSSYPLFLVAEQGYGEGLVRLTVCCGFASTIISTFAQNLSLGFMASA